MSGINKLPVSTLQRPEAIAVGKLGRRRAGRPHRARRAGQAIYAYPLEHYLFWQQACQQHGRAMPAAHCTTACWEKLTISGLLEQHAYVGDVLEFADCRLQITRTAPALLQVSGAHGHAPGGEADGAKRPLRLYLAVLQAVHCAPGKFRILPGPRELSMAEAFRRRLRRLD
jgi:hypothetical protein